MNKNETSSLDSWTAKAAREIINTCSGYTIDREVYWADDEAKATPERIAAIIARHAEPLVALLRESRREHLHGDDWWQCYARGCQHNREVIVRLIALLRESKREHSDRCNKMSEHSDGGYDFYEGPRICVCGADAWNKRVDTALSNVESRG